MMIALSKYEQEMKDYLDKVTLMAPCYTFGPALALPLDFKPEMKKTGVYALNGPNFDLTRICADLNEVAC